MIFLSEHYEGDRIRALTFPMHMLAAFSIELYMKAWLLSAGVASQDVRKMGHKLGELYRAALRNGLERQPEFGAVIMLFGPQHEDFTYRYADPVDRTIHTAVWGEVFPILDKLDIVVDEFIGASKSKGLEPGH